MNDGDKELPSVPDSTPEHELLNPQKYFHDAVSAIRQKAYKAAGVDWDMIESDTRDKVEAAQSLNDIYPLISYVLSKLGDDHSFLITPKREEGVESEDVPHLESYLTPQGYGFINVPSCEQVADLGQSYANTLHRNIRTLDEKAHPKGWIVDLRKNYGGNMWPMIAGLGPLLDDGELGSFIDASGKRAIISYANGESLLNGEVMNKIDDPYTVERRLPAIAVLTSKDTVSSGEITLVALKGQENTKVFGETTHGVPTGNDSISLPDGSTIQVTRSISADRTGKTYSSSIPPDVEVEVDWENIGNDKDPVLEVASEWLTSINMPESPSIF